MTTPCFLLFNPIAKTIVVSCRRYRVEFSSSAWRSPRRRVWGRGGGTGGAAAGGGTGGAAAGGTGGGTGGGGGGAGPYRALNQSDSTTCVPGQVWDAKTRKCLQRHSGVLLDPELTEADRYQEAIDVLDRLKNPNTPRALN